MGHPLDTARFTDDPGQVRQVEFELDGRPWKIAILDERPDVDQDPTLLLFRGDEEEAVVTAHLSRHCAAVLDGLAEYEAHARAEHDQHAKCAALREAAEAVAKMDPWYQDPDDGWVCVFCGAQPITGSAHDAGCTWVALVSATKGGIA